MTLSELAQGHLSRSEAARDGGDHVAGAASATEALAHAQRAGELRTAARASTLLALHLWRQSLAEDAIEVGRAALAEVDAVGAPEWGIELRNTLTMAYIDLGLAGDALPLAVEALRQARRLDQAGLLSLCLNRLHVVYVAMGRLERALELIQQAVLEAERDGGEEVRFGARINLVSTLIALGVQKQRDGELQAHQALHETALAELALAQALAGANPHRQMFCCGRAHSVLSGLRRVEEMGQVVERHQDLARQNRLFHYLALGELLRIDWLLARGQVEAACQALESVGDIDTGSPMGREPKDHATLLEISLKVYKAAGRHELAMQAAEKLLELERRTARQRVQSQSRVLLREVEVEAARDEAKQLRGLATLLQQRAAAATDAAMHDPLTGLANRRALDARLSAYLLPQAGDTPAAAAAPALAVAMIDVDYFKRINDTHGHDAGDQVLRKLGELLGAATRMGDFVARFGGEEFVLLLGDTSSAMAVDICERVQRSVQDHDWQALVPGGVTVSIGLAQARRGEEAAALLRRADAAMYRAKHGGRNRLAVEAA